MSRWLDTTTVKELLHSLLHAELSAYRGAQVSLAPNGLQIDSLERLYLAASVNEFFNLHETGVEDRLLMTESLEAWAELIVEAMPYTSGLSFRTSGSSGVPKTCHQSWLAIETEARALHRRLHDKVSATRVVSWLPLHHLYGFMLGIAYPLVNGLPRLAAGDTLPALHSGDVIVTVPPRWGYLASSRKSWPSDVVGVTSTGPLPQHAAQLLTANGLPNLLEIYGSSETGGVATRWFPAASFELLEHWQRSSCDAISAVHCGERVGLPDHIAWQDTRRFTLQGRRDDLVTIGGTNVSPLEVAGKIEALPEVSHCAVRAYIAGDDQVRLKAYIVPSASEEDASAGLDAMLPSLPAAQRPVSITFGHALPTNALGKLCDW